ncbi:MAG TPA: peptide ABC transporter substrate-binding protein [Anaerolineaceae bacterium]|nr:peptide ABC transporter substrate-binding protein [Anaerolineaceae bacterium]HNZ00615.1 peptide ABC transporter substrate-binding protein [Anaerolineaceae bacterium]HOD43775.1 peptide ABC transporter substrate-binding protein [Anaerolineaceae bacterium]HOH19921.1 peptide ABC transporter substrate-binding protein [Anaerolineaceae bacterium]HOU43663.1 peptide ABC transporter substrate-binding protein [Anaerolineaceae bacterium]
MRKLSLLVGLLVVASMILAACTPAPTAEPIYVTQIVEGTPQVVVITATPAPVEPEPAEMKVLRLNMGPGDIPTLDPALGTDTSSIQIIWETHLGLARQDEVTNEVQPGIAESWDISEDGKVYTFHIRPDIYWVKYNGTEVVQVLDCEGNPRTVKAQDFYYGILRTLAPATASQYAYVLGFALAGAADYNNGVTDDPATVGVKVIDDLTLEMTFIDAAAYNAAIAGMWVAAAQPQWLIEGDDCTEARGDRWTETGFHQSYGPYAMKEWIHDSEITLIKNPFWVGIDSTPEPKIEEVTWVMLDAEPAFAEYEAGNLDAAAVPSTQLDRVKTDPTLSAELVVAPDLCSYYYGFNTQAPVVDDVRVRRALSMAVDRQSLIDNVLKGGQVPAQWFSRPGLAGAPTLESHPDLGVKFNKEEANKVLDEYLAEKGITRADLDLTLMFNTSSGHQKIAEAIQAMWKDNLGVDVKLVNQEWKVYLETVKSADTPQIWRMGWCPDYADANNFIREVFSLNGSSNPADPADPTKPIGGINWLNEDFEAKVREAARELDPVKRVELYAEAEQMLVWEGAAIIPIYWYSRNTTTKPYVTRTFGSGGQESIDKWDIDMTAKP